MNTNLIKIGFKALSLLIILGGLVSLSACSLFSKSGSAGNTKPLTKTEKLIQGRWTCSQMLKDNDVVDFKKVVGSLIMKFNGDKYTMSMGGEERTFKFAISNDTIHFTNVKNYPPLIIVKLEKKQRFECTQYYPNDKYIIKWVMIPLNEK